jgi:hypothetical protein
MRGLSVFGVFVALAGAAAQACVNRLGGLSGCSVLDGVLTNLYAATVAEVTENFEGFRVADHRVAWITSGRYNASTACATTWDVFWCTTNMLEQGRLCDEISNRLKVCGEAVRAFGRCGGYDAADLQGLLSMSDRERDGCFGDCGVRDIRNASGVGNVGCYEAVVALPTTTAMTTTPMTTTTPMKTTTPAATTRGASSTGALPFATTPAPRVVPVESGAGKATAVGWATVVGCGFCTWCSWCKK